MWTREQQSAIQRTRDNTVVYASPGSGKTTVLTEHIVHQLRTNTVLPNQVMMITFTRNAARHMRDRVSRIGGLSHRSVGALRIGTFHAQMFHMLLQAKVPVSPILGQSEQLQLLNRAMGRVGLRGRVHTERLQQLLTEARADASYANPKGVYGRATTLYNRFKEHLGRWDFDDIVEAVTLNIDGVLTAVPPIKYLLVDEFQDTNSVQWSFVTAILNKWGARLLIVGDDDQAIYAFRGASPRWLMNASQLIERTKTFELSVNFRSDNAIVQAASAVIQNNRLRISKSFEVKSTAMGHAEAAVVKSERRESQVLASHLTNLFTLHPDWTIAVLARTRQQLYSAWAECAHIHQPCLEWATFHASKGREWDAVCIVGAVENNPYLREEPADAEEERRLFYVAMTRAKHHLLILSPAKTMSGKARPARFVLESGLPLH